MVGAVADLAPLSASFDSLLTPFFPCSRHGASARGYELLIYRRYAAKLSSAIPWGGRPLAVSSTAPLHGTAAGGLRTSNVICTAHELFTIIMLFLLQNAAYQP